MFLIDADAANSAGEMKNDMRLRLGQYAPDLGQKPQIIVRAPRYEHLWGAMLAQDGGHTRTQEPSATRHNHTLVAPEDPALRPARHHAVLSRAASHNRHRA